MTLSSVDAVSTAYTYLTTQDSYTAATSADYQTVQVDFEDSLELSQEALDLYDASAIKNELPPRKTTGSVEIETMNDIAKRTY